MGDLRIFLRYGIVGYMILCFDLVFTFSLLTTSQYLDYFIEAEIGIIILVLGLPIGWLCYQFYDQYNNRFLIETSSNIIRIRDWQEEFRGELEKKKLKHEELYTHILKVIANIYLTAFIKRKESKDREIKRISEDPREERLLIYSNSQQARGVMSLSLLITYVTYLLIWWCLGFKFPTNDVIFRLSLLIPIVVFIVSSWGFFRVRDEAMMYAWLILRDNKSEIKELIGELLMDEKLDEKFFHKPTVWRERRFRKIR